jgi:hypothetical protein
MTRVPYPDVSGTSPDGRFTLEARSADNGTIPLPDGQPAIVQRWHQRNFRYQLLDTATRRVYWERWQGQGESSPGSLHVSNDGWSILQTSGFGPGFIAVSPSGTEALRVRIYPVMDLYGPVAPPPPVVNPTTPTFDWPALGATGSTAGISWSRHSLPYFIRHAGQPFFVCRTAWDERVVLSLESAALIPESEHQGSPLAAAMDEEEQRWVRELLKSLAPLLDRPTFPNQYFTLNSLRVAFHLVGVHSMTGCIPLIRPWDRFDLPDSSDSSLAIGADGIVRTQALRPILNHSLQRLGETPSPLPAYCFGLGSEACLPDSQHRLQEDRAARASAIDPSMSALEVLELMRAPDHVAQQRHRRPDATYESSETWEFDFQLPTGWQTLSLTWVLENKQGRIKTLALGPSPWLQSSYRAWWSLRPGMF